MRRLLLAIVGLGLSVILGCGSPAPAGKSSKPALSNSEQGGNELERLKEYADNRMRRLQTPTGSGVKKLDWDLSSDNSLTQVGWPTNETSDEYILNQEIDLSLRLADGISFSERGTLLISSRDDENSSRVSRISFHLPNCTADKAREIAKRYIQRWKLKKHFTTETALAALEEWHKQATNLGGDTFLAARHESYPIIDIEIHNSFNDRNPWFVSLSFCVDHPPLPAETVAAFEAIRVGDSSTVRRLLDKGLDPNSKDVLEDSLLHDAAEEGNIAIAKLLISKGAAIDAKGGHEQTPFYEAAISGHLDVADLLLQHGADIDAGSKEGGTALHYLCECFTSPIAPNPLTQCQWLINHKASVNAVDHNGDTPLHKSAWNGHLAPAELLIAAGADLNVTNKDGMTPLDNALRQNQTAIVDLLRKRDPKSP